MKKINNKGFTVVELLITFSIVMVMTLGIFKVVDSYRNTQQEESYRKQIDGYRNEIIRTLNKDFQKKIVKTIEGENINIEDPRTPSVCKDYKQGVKITFEDNEWKYLCVGGKYDNGNYGIMYGKDIQSSIFYESPSKFIDFVDDYIYREDRGIKLVVNDDGPEINENIFSINIKITHSEINDIFEIIIPVSYKEKSDETDTTPKEIQYVVPDETVSDLTKRYSPIKGKGVKLLNINAINEIKAINTMKPKLIEKLQLSTDVFNDEGNDTFDLIRNVLVEELIITNAKNTQSIISKPIPEDIANKINKITLGKNIAEIEPNVLKYYNNTLDISDINRLPKIDFAGTQLERLVVGNNFYFKTEIITKSFETVEKIYELVVKIKSSTSSSTPDLPESLKGKINVLVIGEGCTTIYSSYMDFGIKELRLPSTLESIYSNVFEGNKLEEVDMTNTQIDYLGANAFGRNLIKSVKFSSQLNSLNSTVFQNNPGLTCTTTKPFSCQYRP